MADVAVADLRALDRDVARAYARWRAWQELAARAPDQAAEQDPFDGLRHVAGQSTYVALGELAPSAIDAPLRDALRRWVADFVQARLARETDLAVARAETTKEGRLAVELPRLVDWREAWRGLVASRNAGEARLWLDSAVDLAPKIAAARREGAARRAEIARRLGLADPDDGATVASPRALAAFASALLDATDDLARAVRRERGCNEPADTIVDAVARDAPEGWPARLSPTWLESRFAQLARGARIALPALPPALGASSFARALGAFGYALREAGGGGLPFALARDFAFADAHRFALVFAALPARADFHRAALGTSRRVALAQARVLARASLFAARLGAARWLISTTAGDFEELTARVLGAPMPRALAGAWPAARRDEPARVFALATALPLERELVERFDVDWFANPRAAAHLRAIAAGPARPVAAPEAPTFDAAASASALARAFEEALG